MNKQIQDKLNRDTHFLLSIYDVAQILGVSSQTIRRWIRKGWISYVKNKGERSKTWFWQSHIDDFLKRNERKAE